MTKLILMVIVIFLISFAIIIKNTKIVSDFILATPPSQGSQNSFLRGKLEVRKSINDAHSISSVRLSSGQWLEIDAGKKSLKTLKYLSLVSKRISTDLGYVWKEWLCEPIFAWKKANLNKIISHFSTPHAGLIQAMLMGETTLLSNDLRHNLKITGMQHVVSASGYNVGLVVGLSSVALSRFSRFYRLACLLAVILMYAALTNFTPSIVRASLMTTLSLVGREWWGRQTQPLRLLVVVAVVMVLFQPSLITSVSFQLSVTATLGIICLVPLMSSSNQWAAWESGQTTRLWAQPTIAAHQLTPRGWGQRIRTACLKVITTIATTVVTTVQETFQVTLAAQALTLPVSLYHFGELSLLSVVANVSLLWLTPLITLVSAWYVVLLNLAGFSELSLHLVGVFFGWILRYPIDVFLWGSAWFGQFEGTLVTIQVFPLAYVLECWVGVAVVYGWLIRRQRQRHQANCQTGSFFKLDRLKRGVK